MQLPNYKLFYVHDLLNYPENSRTHSEEQIQELINSIKEFGFTNPLLIDEKNVLIAGHARLQAAKSIGFEQLPCIVLDHLNDVQKAALVIADNKIALNAGWDFIKLSSQILWLQDKGFNIDLTGFKAHEISSFLIKSDSEGLTDPDSVPEITDNPITKMSDVWLLGEHRLMCGNSKSIDDLNLLMNGIKADMVYTDPPYGINEETDRDLASRTKVCKANTFSKIIGDDSIETAIAAYNLCEGFEIPVMVFWGANYYCHSLPQSNNWLIWDKRVEDKQRDMNSDCELAWVKSSANSVRIFRHLWKGMIKASENGEGRVHPTQKPIALAEWCFNEYGKNAQSIIDLFGGSGSTLIACEKTNRQCLMMELSPLYCDVIIKRWKNFSGKDAILESNQKTYKELSHDSNN
jgi:DNA modification methylase